MNKFKIALVGNPNCGKTTLFNLLTGARQHVGNWAGVTVEKKEGYFNFRGVEYEVIDLPGIYSMSPHSAEEIIARNYIMENKPDIVINIVDGTTFERSFYLTTQLIDMKAKYLIAVNMYDEVEKKGISIDIENMKELIKAEIIPISSKREKGIPQLLEAIDREAKKSGISEVNIGYGEDVENALIDIGNECKKADIGGDYRWISLLLLSNDKETIDRFKNDEKYERLLAVSEKKRKTMETIYNDDTENIISDKRFGYAMGITRECVTTKKLDLSKIDITEKIDNVILNKYLSFPIFAGILWLTFQLTFFVGGIFTGFIDTGVNGLGGIIKTLMPNGILKDLIVDGIISGVGGILVFLPQILILFLMIAILEDSGYMARVAFIMDRMMHFLGVHGKSFISLFMGIGCNVPGIMAARTLENEEDRKVTVLINPFMSCSARLPIYVLIAGMYFKENAGTVIFSLYIIGIIVAIFTAKILKMFFFKKKSVPFVMELPPYRAPSAKSLMIHMWERASMFIKKMGGVILVGSIIIWVLGYFPTDIKYSGGIIKQEQAIASMADSEEKTAMSQELDRIKNMEKIEKSYIGQIGKTIEPFFTPLGFGWKEGVALITGIVGKEIVVSTMSVLYGTADTDNDKLKEKMVKGGVTPVAAFGFLVFVLLYVPCFATVAAILKETNSLRWTTVSIIYGIGIAYLLSFAVNALGQLIL